MIVYTFSNESINNDLYLKTHRKFAGPQGVLDFGFVSFVNFIRSSYEVLSMEYLALAAGGPILYSLDIPGHLLA